EPESRLQTPRRVHRSDFQARRLGDDSAGLRALGAIEAEYADVRCAQGPEERGPEPHQEARRAAGRLTPLRRLLTFLFRGFADQVRSVRQPPTGCPGHPPGPTRGAGHPTSEDRYRDESYFGS